MNFERIAILFIAISLTVACSTSSKDIVPAYVSPTSATSNLPLCSTPDHSQQTELKKISKWHNCWGTYKSEIFHGLTGQVEGEWRNGLPNGQGTLKYLNGNLYEGSFINGKFNGQGTLKFVNGDLYIGSFKNGNFGGQGNLIYANGDKFSGHFKDGKLDGKGNYLLKNGNHYEGDFKGGAPNGSGILIYKNGDKYTGGIKNGQFDGKGTLEFANGDKYMGDFKAGKYQGKGKISISDGRTYEGDFKDGWANGSGIFTFANGNRYVGSSKDGNLNGQGTLYFSNGDRHEGEFVNGLSNGKGTYFYSDGSKIIGTFKNGQLEGSGIFISAQSQKIEVEFKEGKLVRKNDDTSSNTINYGRGGSNLPPSNNVDIDSNIITEAKQKCEDLGFRLGTESFSNCTLTLYEKNSDNQKARMERNIKVENDNAAIEASRQQTESLKAACEKEKKSRALEALSCSLQCFNYQMGTPSQLSCNQNCQRLNNLIPKCD